MIDRDAVLAEILTRVRTMETVTATGNVRLEYLAAAMTETRERVLSLERWRWTAGGVIVVAAMFAPHLIGLIR